jgi:hypothetical protein
MPNGPWFSLSYHGRVMVSDPGPSASFGEPDLRRANRAGARISAAQIAAVLERRPAIEQNLQAIAPDASLAGPADSVPWLPLGQRDLDRNQASVRAVRQELARDGYRLTEVRILDLLILSAAERPAVAQRSVTSLRWPHAGLRPCPYRHLGPGQPVNVAF